jgi:hypothetical protein
MNWQSIERFASFPKMETELEYRITQREAKEILALRADLAAAIARVKELEARDDTWRAKKAVLENDLGKAWEENKRLREAVEWAISVVDEVASKMTDKPALYHDNKAAWEMMADELRRRAKEG